MGFQVEADAPSDSEQYDREPHEQNVLYDIIEYSRSKQVLNEEQTLLTILVYATGLLPNWEDYVGAVITGGSAGGKSHMKQHVVDDMFAYVPQWLYNPVGVSATAIIDDPEWDEAKIGALNELQKMPSEMLEFLKSAHGDDGGFDYRRNVSDADSDSGFSAAKIERDPKPTVFMLADENSFGVEAELKTRLIEIKVDENAEKNRGVHQMKWGHERITLPSAKHEYVWEDEELEHMVRAHIRDMEKGLEGVDDVVIPTGDGRFEGDDWDAGDVMAPFFNFELSEATRASSMVASLVKASAALNYHARDTVELDGETVLVVEPTDVANIIAARRTLLALTHGLTEKKFAVLDAIRESGGLANKRGTAVQARKQDIIEEIQDNDKIATLSKTEITEILDDLDESLIINKKDNPENRTENLYVYDGSNTFEAPNIFDYYEQFKGVEDPIKEQPIEETIDEQLKELNAKMDVGTLGSSATTSTDGSEGGSQGLGAFEDGDDGGTPQLDEVEAEVAQRLERNVSGMTVPATVVSDNDLQTEHLIGVTPTEVKYDDEVWPQRKPSAEDKAESIMSPKHKLWDDEMSYSDVETAIDTAIEALKDKGVLNMEMQSDGSLFITVSDYDD